MASWIYTACETDPGFLVGGVPRNLGRSFHQGTGPRFIIEGDEYNAAYFDRGAKFLMSSQFVGKAGLQGVAQGYGVREDFGETTNVTRGRLGRCPGLLWYCSFGAKEPLFGRGITASFA